MRISVFSLLLALILVVSGCAGTPIRTGDSGAKTVATGAAGGATATDVNPELERCDQPFGTVAVVEDQNANWYYVLTRQYNLSSTVPVLRLLIQQSNCFIVVERGRAMSNVMEERALQSSGELRAGSNFGKGQMVSADYSLTPEVLFSEKGTSGLGGVLGVFGIGGSAAGAVLGGLKSNEAATILTLVDNRSSVQVAAAEGSAKNMDLGLFGGLAGSGAAGGLGGYTKTPEGKVIAGAFMNSYNQLVLATRNYSGQTMGDRGLGTGGRLTVEGSRQKQGYSGEKLSLKKAQEKLSQLGYDVGVADGIMGRKTEEGLRKYQQDRGLQVTGRLDEATQAELLSE